jgi:hypothetical protein
MFQNNNAYDLLSHESNYCELNGQYRFLRNSIQYIIIYMKSVKNYHDICETMQECNSYFQNNTRKLKLNWNVKSSNKNDYEDYAFLPNVIF